MKLKHIHIENFKGIKNLDIPLVDDNDEPRRLTCFIGDNGSGKTTILQAIALTLSLATGRTSEVTRFRWNGFLPDRISSLGKARVELTVTIEDEEKRYAQEIYDRAVRQAEMFHSLGIALHSPKLHREMKIVYDNGAIAITTEAEGRLRGRFYAQILSRVQPDVLDLVPHVGDVFWFDQYRSLGAIDHETETTTRNGHAEGWVARVDELRDALVKWSLYQISVKPHPRKDNLKQLEERFALFFPGTRFLGTAPKEASVGTGGDEFYFLLERAGREYDIAEMSSGEQAIFCLLYEFVRLQIAKSVVLIDELELHLHPPAQQALYAALPKMGKDCQFFITTHSEFLTDIIPDRHIFRLEGGRPCL